MRVMVDAGLDRAIQGEMDLLRTDVRNSRSRLEALLDDDFVEIGASGQLWYREALIADLLASPAADVTVADIAARRVGDRIVVVTYITLASDRRVLRSSWWRESADGWRCFFHQGTLSPQRG